MEQSYVQIYTGNGKGKTTAAIGLAVRAAGGGKTVKIVQFLKGRESGEQRVIGQTPGIELVRVSDCKKFFRDLDGEERDAMRQSVCRLLPVIEGWLGHADLVILDEVMAAMACGILETAEVLRLIEGRGGTEIILTGRDAPEEILQKAHLVTEMREVKHYFHQGVKARRGIEY